VIPVLAAVQADTAQVLNLESFLATKELNDVVRGIFLLVVGIPGVWMVSGWVRRWASRAYSPQRGLVLEKVLFYPSFLVIVITALSHLGFQLAPLMGAAGIMGIAIGFASQTSVSNIISGFFLIAEEPFAVNDVIQVGDLTGQVLTIDMLSVKLRTFDNKLVRIPNETLVKSQVTNATRFPIRRMDIPVSIAYKENLGRVRDVLLEVAERNPRILLEPEPLVIFQGYGDSSVDLLFTAWTRTQGWLEVKNLAYEEIKERLDAEGIEIPFPHVTIYTGTVTDPFPIRVVKDDQ